MNQTKNRIHTISTIYKTYFGLILILFSFLLYSIRFMRSDYSTIIINTITNRAMEGQRRCASLSAFRNHILCTLYTLHTHTQDVLCTIAHTMFIHSIHLRRIMALEFAYIEQRNHTKHFLRLWLPVRVSCVVVGSPWAVSLSGKCAERMWIIFFLLVHVSANVYADVCGVYARAESMP